MKQSYYRNATKLDVLYFFYIQVQYIDVEIRLKGGF